MSRRIRVAVVGLGGIAQAVHLPLLNRRGDLFEIVALADLSASRTHDIGESYGVPASRQHRTTSDIVAAQGELHLDGVVLATSGSHGSAVRALVAAGIAVLCEKPMAFSAAEITAIEDAAAAAGRDLSTQVLVGYMKEHDPATARAREELAGKTLRAVTVEVLHPADQAQLAFAHLRPPALDLDPATLARLSAQTERAVDDAVGADTPAHLRTLYTNVVLGSIVHDISLLRHLVGGVATVETAVHWPAQMPGSVEVTGTVAGGARLHVGWHFLPQYPDYRETVTFHHETGTVQLGFPVPYLLNAPTELTVVSRSAGGTVGAPGEVRAEHRWRQQEAFENELEAFHAMVSTGVVPSSGVREGRADVITAQRVLAALAAREGAVIGGEAGRR